MPNVAGVIPKSVYSFTFLCFKFKSKPANVPTDDVSAGTTLQKASAGITASNKILGTSVLLQEGFWADTRTVFKTQLGGCN